MSPYGVILVFLGGFAFGSVFAAIVIGLLLNEETKGIGGTSHVD